MNDRSLVATRVRKALVFLIVAAVIAWSIVGIDWSSLGSFSASLAGSVFTGLAHPDWSYLWDGSGEDVISLMLLTIGIAFLGTAIACVLAFPITLLASRVLWKHPVVPRVFKFVLNILRAFPELIYAIIFVKVVGPGPFAGVLAIGVHQIGMLGKLWCEEMEAMSDEPVEAVQAVGGNFWQAMFYARIPHLMPMWTSIALNHFEIAVRSAATLGLVGAGGIGAPLIFAIQARSWDKVSVILLGVIVTVFAIDLIGGAIRKRLK